MLTEDSMLNRSRKNSLEAEEEKMVSGLPQGAQPKKDVYILNLLR